MSERTKEELRDKARIVLLAKETNDPRWVQLQVLLSAIFGITPEDVDVKVKEYADYKGME